VKIMRLPKNALFPLLMLGIVHAPCLAAQGRASSAASRNLPSPQEVMRLLMTLQDVPLKGNETCATAGTSLSDTDIGDYISGWLVELKPGQGANWIDAKATPAAGDDKQAGWKCVVMFRHVNGDDRWGWGVSFHVRASDHKPVKESIRCLGGG